MNYILTWFFMTIGLHEILAAVWRYLEEIELGTTVVTKIDTLICFVIAGVLCAWCISTLD